jgi:hypothetical protein
MKDDFDLDHPLPIFLSSHADEPEQRRSSRVLKAGIAITTVATVSAIASTTVVTVSAIAITLTLGNPVKVFAVATAPFADISAPRHVIEQTTSAIQSTADTSVTRSIVDAQVSAQAADAAPTHDEVAAAHELVVQSQMGNDEPQSDALFKQFQAWATKKDTRAQNTVQPVQVALAQVAENSSASERPVQKQRKTRSLLNARAEMRHIRKHRATVDRDQTAQMPAGPALDARAQEQSEQSDRAPSFVQSFGWHR